MEFKNILIEFRMVYNCNFSFAFKNYKFIVGREKIEKGLLDNYAASFKKNGVTIFFEKPVEIGNSLKILSNLIREHYKTDPITEDLTSILLGTYDKDMSSFPHDITNVINHKIIYIKHSLSHQNQISNIIEPFFNEILSIEIDNSLFLFVPLEIKKNDFIDIASTLEAEFFYTISAIIGPEIQSLNQIWGLNKKFDKYSKFIENYNLQSKIHYMKDLEFYNIIDGIDISKNDITFNIHLIDPELKLTIESYFLHDLNLTDTAAALFIHRNTLLYRLNKLEKSTGYDIRKFSDAFEFYLIWILNKKSQ